MSALESADLQDSATARLVSQNDQPTGPSVLPPFSGNLNVDEKLKLSNENFKQTIDDFFKDQNISALSQLTATSAFPTPHVLAQFASKAYTDYKAGETDAQYETRLALPDGWKLLTTASNGSKTNGYFGAAYWHPKLQQVVIAHRGTKPKNIGALWTDLVGVVFQHHVPQMGSASTFAHKVVEVLRKVKWEHRVSFQLFFTGHSLGGWLAQITTFTTEYLKRDGNIFLQGNDEQDCYHPHTVVFDSPGCKDMLLKMTDKFDVRLDGRSIDLEHLDITSFLSAPNRINTCNAHLGTVYRIFPDLSDMGEREKSTALYNVVTHGMDKIVQSFDPETGQVYRDEQGQLKIQVVVDWPISAGLMGGGEYMKFFEWAKHFNNYHPNIKDISLQYMHYYPIRYQTKLYDERVDSLSIFSEEEQEFLEHYRWLRQWSEFFKPKELFSEMEKIQAQEDAEKVLQNFEIEKDTIRCTDASALQALIPYVKRLLQLFPQIKESTKRALLSEDVRNRVYQFETRRYVERINQSPLDFKADASSFREFLENGQQKFLHLQLVKGDEWTGIIKVYQVLQKTGCLCEGQYTVLKLKRLLKLNQLMNFNKLMQSTVTPQLLLMACEDNQELHEETKDVIRTLFDTIKQNPNIKIIFITPSEGRTVDFLYHMGRRISGEVFVRKVEKLNWSDLTASSQEKLLEKSVKFQGAQISLNELMSAECPVANFLPLCTLLKEKELNIADPLPICNAYNRSCYIERAFRRQIAIKLDIQRDKLEEKFRDLLVGSKKRFRQLCQQKPKSNVHWLVTEKSGKLVWQQSQGSLETLRRYIDTESSPTYTADDLDKLFEQAQYQRVMLISDTAGMGKSTVLTHLSRQIKQKFPAKWVVRIDLNDHTGALNALKQEQIDKEKAVEFVSEKLLKLKPGLEMELFKQCCEQKQKVRTVIMLDGFDEISPYYKQTVIDLLHALMQTEVEQLWVTTRPHLREELEDKLQQLSYTLEPFSEGNQVEFLKKHWSLQEWFAEAHEKEEEVEKNKLEIYAEHLVKKLAESISDKDRQFTGIPLHTRMLAEAFDREVEIFYRSSESMPELKFKLELIDLFERFIERKYEIYQMEKLQVPVNSAFAIEQRERDLKTMREDHQLLALKVLFTEEQVALLQNNRQSTFSPEQLTRIGIVQVSHDGKPHFIHRTFAEYCVADYLVKRLAEGNNTSKQVQTFILKDIFLEAECRGIRVFMNGLLSRTNLSDEVFKHYGNMINYLGIDFVLIIHQVAVEYNANIIAFLLDCLQAAGHRIRFTDMRVRLLNRSTHEAIKRSRPLGSHIDIQRSKAVFVRDKKRELDKLQELLKWSKFGLKREKINNLLLGTDEKGRTLWHVAAKVGELKVLQNAWVWAKRDLAREEIINKLLLATDIEGNTALHVAAEEGKLEVLQKIWEWAKEELTTEEIKNKLLLATDCKGRTVWHVAAKRDNFNIY